MLVTSTLFLRWLTSFTKFIVGGQFIQHFLVKRTQFHAIFSEISFTTCQYMTLGIFVLELLKDRLKKVSAGESAFLFI